MKTYIGSFLSISDNAISYADYPSEPLLLSLGFGTPVLIALKECTGLWMRRSTPAAAQHGIS
jgi:hypothetical protein